MLTVLRAFLRFFFVILTGFSCIIVSTGIAAAMTFRSEVIVNQPFGALTGIIYANGEIAPGDAARLIEAVESVDTAEIMAIFVIFDSPGGNLYEGIAMGEALAAYPKSVVGRIDGDCASACNFAFIGAHYRMVADDGRFGVHQFSFSGGNSADISAGQIVSADVARFLTDQGVDIAFLQRMALMPPDGIDWIPIEELKRMGIVNGILKQESVEIDIVESLPVLSIRQTNVFGEYSLWLVCLNGMLIGNATLQDPERNMTGYLALGLDGQDHLVPEGQWQIEQSTGGRTTFSFRLLGSVGDLASQARWIGVFVYDPTQTLWYGFEVEVKDNSQYAVLRDCSGS